MDIFQMNPKAIGADMAFHHPHDMQAFYRMHNINRFLFGPHAPGPNRTELGVRLFRNSSRDSWIQPSLKLDKTTLSQITPAQLMRKAATVRNTQVTQSGTTPMEVAMGKRPRDLMEPAHMVPEQLTSTPTKQDLLNEEIQKLALKTHLHVQQREGIRRNLAEGIEILFTTIRE